MVQRTLRLSVAAAAAACVAAFGPRAHSDVTVAGTQGPSTQTTPMLVPTAPGVRFVSILTTGESVNPKFDGVTPYVMIGLPDGMGAFDNGDGTLTMLSNHEIGSTSGVARAHGSTGATVSAWTVDRRSLEVRGGADLIRVVLLWDAVNQRWTQGTAAFQRFCSADLPAVTALYDAASGKGTRNRIFFNGEETSGGRAFAHVATGPNAGVSVELPRMGRDAWENVVPCPFPQEKTVVVGIDDTSPGQVYVYVGTKQSQGSDVQRAGLANGAVYGVIANGVRTEDRTTGVGIGKGQSAPFTMADLGNASAAGYVTEATADAAGVTEWLRPEDGAWDPSNPADFYFVTTDRFDQTKNGTGSQVGRSRLYRLRFSDLANPQQGGTVTLLLDGTEAHNMFDNLCVDARGHVILQEDPGNVSWQCRIWRYTIATGELTELGRADPARFGQEGVAATSPFSADEESSGIVDASDLLGPGWFLLCMQAHGGISPGTEVVENGQFLAMFDPACAAGPSFLAPPAASPSAATVSQAVTFRAEASVPGGGTVTYAWDFGDGTQGAGAVVQHAYAQPGSYTAVATATHAATGTTAQQSVDVSVSRPVAQASLVVALDFANEGRDTLTLRGAVPLPAGFSPSGKQVTVDVGGVVRTFSLDGKGRAAPADGTFAILVRRTRGQVAAQRAPFVFTLKRTDLSAALADEGLVDGDRAGVPVTVPVEVVFDGTAYETLADLIYVAKAGRKGTAR